MKSWLYAVGILVVLSGNTMMDEQCLAVWNTEVVDDSTYCFGSIIQFDTSYNPHILFKATNTLKYAISTGSIWQSQVIESGIITDAFALATDTLNHPHVAFTDADSNLLKYAWLDGATWHIDTVSAENTVLSEYCSMDLDSQNQPHLIFIDTNGTTVKHAWKEGSEWHYENIGDFSQANSTALSLDELDQIHVCFFMRQTSSERPHLIYGKKTTGTWSFEIADVQGGSRCSLAIDDWGFAHIGYCKSGSRSIMGYTVKDENGWHPFNVDTYLWNGMDSTIAVTHDRYPQLVYYGHAWHSGKCVYAYKDQWGWHIEDISSMHSGLHPSLALDDQELPHLTFTNMDGYLIHTWNDSPNPSPTPTPQSTRTWIFEQVFNGGPVESNSLKNDSSGQPHIAFQDRTAEVLKYASRDNHGWHIDTVDVYGRVGYGTQLDMTQSDSPKIVYLGIDFKTKFAYKDTSGWHIELIQSAFGVSDPMCIRSHMDERVDVLYQNTSFDGTTYASRDSSGREREFITIGGMRFSGSALAVDTLGLPHVFGTLEDGNCVHAWKTESGWLFESVPCIGDYVHMMLDESGYPQVISFSDDELQYLYKDAEGYHSEMIDERDVEYFGDMTCDMNGTPHLLYAARRLGVSEIRYAFRASDRWQIETIPFETGGVFKGSIDLDDQNGIHVSFNTSRLTYGYSGPGLPPTTTPMPGTTPTPTPTFHYNPSATPSPPPSFTPSPTPSGTATSPWTVETFNDGGQACGDLKVDSHSNPCAVVTSINRDMLLYARQQSGSWEYEPIADYSWVKEASLDLDVNDSPLISTIGHDEDYLQAYWQDGGLWQTAELDLGLFIDTDCRIAPDGTMHIAYYAEMGELRYACRDAEGWHTQAIMMSDYHVLAGYLSMDLDSESIPHIVLSSGEMLYYVTQVGAGWEIEPIDLGADQPCFPAMDLDTQDFPHLTYYERLHNILKYLYKDADGWHLEGVNNQYELYNLNAFVLDSSDRPHVFYYHFGRMNYGYNGGDGWMFETVAEFYDNPGRVAIDVSESGDSVHIGSFVIGEEHRHGFRAHPGLLLNVNTEPPANPAPIQSINPGIAEALRSSF